jgi:hypothetical protein
MYIVVPIFMLLSVLDLEAMAGLHKTSCLVDINDVK